MEQLQPAAWESEGSERCQTISRLPPDADRVRILVTQVTGGARDLHVRIVDAAGSTIAAGVHGVQFGENTIKLGPRTRAAHPASLCLSSPGPGQIVVAGESKRVPGEPDGNGAETQGVPSAIFLRPGSSSWVAQTGTIADRYANAQTGATGSWSLWAAALLAVAAAALALWTVVTRPGRRT